MKQEFETPGTFPGPIPYKWEAAPGRPMVDSAPVVPETCASPLRPPPGVRRNTTLSQATFEGFEPQAEASELQMAAGKFLKKLEKLRKKSMVAASCFSSDNSKAVAEQSKLFAMADAARCYDSDSHSGFSASASDQPETPSSATSSTDCSCSDFLKNRYPQTTSSRSSPFSLEDGDESNTCHENNGCEEAIPNSGPLSGPSAAAWHQTDTEDPIDPPPWQMRRSPTLISALMWNSPRNSTSDRSSFKHLTLGRTFRTRSKSTKPLELGTS